MVARTDRLQLVLEANADKLTQGVNKAAKSLESLDKATAKGLGTVEARFAKLERAVGASLAGIENRIGRVGGRISTFGSGSTAALDSFAASASAALDRATKRLEAFATESIRTRNQLEKLQNVRLDRLGADLTKAASQATNLGNAAQKGATGGINAFAGFERGVDSLIGKVARAAVSVQGLFLAAGTGAGAGAPVKFAADFERALAGVDTLLEEGGVAIGKYREQLLALSGGSSKSLFDLTKGLNDIISAGIPAVEGAGGAFDVLAASQKAATTAGAETAEVAKGVATVLNIYKDAGLSASDVTDKFFTAAARGAITIPELSASLGQVASVAKGFGVGLDETLGILTSLTKGGLSTAEAVSSLRQILISTARPPKEVTKEIDKLNKAVEGSNVAFGVAAIQQKGVLGVLDELNRATGGSSEAFAKLFTDVDGLKGVLNLSAQGFESVRKEVDAVGKATGATDVAYKKVAGTFNETFGVLKNRVLAVLIEAGQRVLPQVQAAFTKFGDFVVKNQTKIAETFERFIEGLFSIGRFLSEQGPGILKFLVTFFAVKKITEATQAIAGFVAKLKESQALSQAGGNAATSFATGFQKTFKSIGGVIAQGLKSAPVIGGFIAIGFALGEALVDGIASVLGKELERIQAEALKNIKELEERRQQLARDRGFATPEEQEETLSAFERGELLRVGTGKGKGSFQSPEQVLSALGPDKLEAAALERIQELEGRFIRQNTAATDLFNEAAAERNRLNRQGSRLTTEESDRLRQNVASLEAQAVAFRERAKATRESAQAVRDLTESAREDAEFAKAEGELDKTRETARAAREKGAAAALNAKAKSTEEAKRAAAELARLLAEGEEAARAALAQRIDNEQFSVEQRIAAQREVTDAAVESAERVGAAEEDVRAIRLEGAEQVRALVEEQARLIEAAGVQEIVTATEVANKQIAEAARSVETQKALQEKLAQDVLAIEQRTIAATAEARKKADREIARQRIVLSQNQGGQRGGGTSGTQATFLEQAQGVVGAARDPLGALADLPGVPGQIGKAAQLIAQLPEVIGGLATLLSGEALGQFFEALVENAGRFFETLLERITDLPDLAEKILDTVPGFIEKLIAGLPAFVAALVTDVLPKLIAGIVTIIPSFIAALVAGIFQGLARLFEQLFAAIRDLPAAIARAIGSGAEKAAEGVADFARGASTFASRTIGVSALNKIADGDFGSLGVEDIPLIGGLAGLFHKGGTIPEGKSNPLAAAAMTGVVPSFQTGGMVEAVSQRIRNAFGGVFADDTPALLQAGEGVLRRQAVDRLGGPNAVDAINRGGGVPGGPTEVRIEARDGAVRDLLAMIVSKITVEAKTPGTGLQTALQQNPRALGTNDVRARRLG